MWGFESIDRPVDQFLRQGPVAWPEDEGLPSSSEPVVSWVECGPADKEFLSLRTSLPPPPEPMEGYSARKRNLSLKKGGSFGIERHECRCAYRILWKNYWCSLHMGLTDRSQTLTAPFGW